jgi:flagellar biosynthesis chaperone FliJ
MDIMKQIDEQIVAMGGLKTKLAHEVDALGRELSHAESDKPGIMSKIAMFVGGEVELFVGLEGVMKSAIERMRAHNIDTADEYIDHLKRAIQESRDSVSNIDNIVSNLNTCRHDLAAQIDRSKTWIDKARDLQS